MFPQIDKKQMGQRLRKIMKEKRVTPKDVQQYLGLSCVQTVYRWMEGVNVPCVDHLYALSILLEVTVDELITGEPQKKYHVQECGYRPRDLFVIVDMKGFFYKNVDNVGITGG